MRRCQPHVLTVVWLVVSLIWLLHGDSYRFAIGAVVTNIWAAAAVMTPKPQDRERR